MKCAIIVFLELSFHKAKIAASDFPNYHRDEWEC